MVDPEIEKFMEINRLCHALRENGEERGRMQARLTELQGAESKLIMRLRELAGEGTK